MENGFTIERLAGHPFLEHDAVVLRALCGWFSIGGRERFSVHERDEVLHRVAACWPSELSPLVRLAAVAHDLEEALEERFARAPGRVAAFAGRAPWSVEPGEVETLRLAVLVCLDQIDYASWVPTYGTPTTLRDALTGPEDLSTIAAMVRWESLERLEVSTPDRLLLSWGKHVSTLEARGHAGHAGTDPSEYTNTLDIRDDLQRFVAVLSWGGQGEWRAHIEPVDDSFRGCTERQSVPLVLRGDAQPGGWWRYRVPVGAAGLPGWAIRPIKPERYVAAGHSFGLRTISHVSDLAKRPHGLAAMTDQELDRWAALCGYQADALERIGKRGSWSERHERVDAEKRRRAADKPSSN